MAYLTQDEKSELFDAYVQRFREAEIGPVSFRKECEKIGISADDIREAHVKFVDECADNMRRKYAH